MNPLRNALQAVGMSACLLMPAVTVDAGIIDDNANDADHIALAAQSQFNSVGVVKRLGTIVDSSGILISPQWVLTAAHTIPSGTPNAADTWTFGSEVRHIAQTLRNPSFTGSIANGYDIALHRLDTPITSITPSQLYSGTAASLIGQTLTYVGYGKSGTGSTGDTIAAGTKRAGRNVGEQLGYTLNPGPSQTVYSNQILMADMDVYPGSGYPWGNPLGSTFPVNLEYLIALGDSGGGLFVEQAGQTYVAGVHSVLFDFDPTGTLGYGDIMGSTTIAQSLAWIQSIINPAPIIGDLNGDGYVGLDDLDIVLGNWNQNVTPSDLLLGDASGDGYVGIADLDIVLGNWNDGTPPILDNLNGLAPEPGTIAVLGIAGAGLLLRRRSVTFV